MILDQNSHFSLLCWAMEITLSLADCFTFSMNLFYYILLEWIHHYNRYMNSEHSLDLPIYWSEAKVCCLAESKGPSKAIISYFMVKQQKFRFLYVKIRWEGHLTQSLKLITDRHANGAHWVFLNKNASNTLPFINRSFNKVSPTILNSVRNCQTLLECPDVKTERECRQIIFKGF